MPAGHAPVHQPDDPRRADRRALAAALNLPAPALADAYECGGTTSGPAGNFIPVAGGNQATLSASCPALQWPDDLSAQAWDGGAEPWDHAAFTARARGVLSTLRDRHADGTDVIALVTHSDFTQFLLAEVLGHTPTTIYDGGTFFHTDHTGTTHLNFTDQGTRVHWVNRADHLPPELRTN